MDVDFLLTDWGADTGTNTIYKGSKFVPVQCSAPNTGKYGFGVHKSPQACHVCTFGWRTSVLP